MPSELPKKILIVRFSSIGDIILTSPVVRCLKLQQPDIIIHYLTKSKYAELLNYNPFISKIFCIQRKISEVIPDLRHEKYDLVIDLHRNFRTFLLRLFLFRPFLTFRKLNFRKFLIVLFKINLLPEKHIVHRMMQPLKKLNVQFDGQGLDFYLPDTIREHEKVVDFVSSHPDYYVFSIAGTYFTKRCPNDKIIEICRKIRMPVILTGGTNEWENGEIISRETGTYCLNACGVTTVEESAFLIKNSRFVISNDTGMMHIAAALKKPVISLWGNTIPEFGMTPLLPDHFIPQPEIVEVKGLRCRPCSKLGYQCCPKKHFKCMNNLDNNAIFQYLVTNNLMSSDISSI